MMLNYRKYEEIVDTFESVMIESREISAVDPIDWTAFRGC